MTQRAERAGDVAGDPAPSPTRLFILSDSALRPEVGFAVRDSACLRLRSGQALNGLITGEVLDCGLGLPSTSLRAAAEGFGAEDHGSQKRIRKKEKIRDSSAAQPSPLNDTE